MILLVITYLAGVLTILSPCILPVLPFVFSKAQGSFLKNILPLLLGMALTFSLLSGAVVLGSAWIGRANEYGRVIALVFLSLFALTLIFPHVSETLLAPLTRLGSKIGSGNQSGLLGSVLVGVSTGLLWAPCAGPILGIVLTGAATQNNTSMSILLLIAYSLGAITSLSIAIFAGQKVFGRMKKLLAFDRGLRLVLGCAVLLGVFSIAFNLDRTVLTKVSRVGTESFENKLLALAQQGKTQESIEGQLPELDGAIAWLNSKPLTREDLRGHVVLIDFWTYSCINCLRTLPYVKAWAEKYKDQGLIVIGVHTPEFAFEKDRENVEKAVNDLGINYPVAVDSDYKIWKSFHNQFWPAHYFIDRQGNIRHHHFGEGQYAESENVILQLLADGGSTETNSAGMKVELADSVQATGVEVGPSAGRYSPETYVGYKRSKNFASMTEFKPDQSFLYTAKTLEKNQWALAGMWKVEGERAVSQAKKASVLYKFRARDLHLVLGTSKKSIHFRVLLDGQAPKENHGVDIDADGQGEVKAHRLYQLIRQKGEDQKQEHLFEIEFSEPGVEVYAFTFG